jgi:hypothetical protein
MVLILIEGLPHTQAARAGSMCAARKMLEAAAATLQRAPQAGAASTVAMLADLRSLAASCAADDAPADVSPAFQSSLSSSAEIRVGVVQCLSCCDTCDHPVTIL